jgi:hypothetical protein
MKAIIIVLALTIWLLPAANASSDAIYTWTDANGVQRFSNDPPENVDNYQRIETKDVRPDSNGDADKRRTSYDRMVEQAVQERRRLKQEERAREAKRIAEEKRLAKERRQEKIDAERKRLMEQIEAIKNRAVSPTNPPGMKQAQIDKIQKQIDALEKNPDADAPSKQEKAAESKSGY